MKLVAGVLDKLGIERFTVIGHSLGGEVATALAEAHPARVKRIVLIDSQPKAETTFKLGTRLALTPVLGELFARLKSNAMVRKGLAQGFAPRSQGLSILLDLVGVVLAYCRSDTLPNFGLSVRNLLSEEDHSTGGSK